MAEQFDCAQGYEAHRIDVNGQPACSGDLKYLKPGTFPNIFCSYCTSNRDQVALRQRMDKAQADAAARSQR